MSTTRVLPITAEDLHRIVPDGPRRLDDTQVLYAEAPARVPLATPVLNPLAWLLDGAAAQELSGVPTEDLHQLMMGSRYVVDGRLVEPSDETIAAIKDRGLTHGAGVARLLAAAFAPGSPEQRRVDAWIMTEVVVLPYALRADQDGMGETQALYANLLQSNYRLDHLMRSGSPYGQITHAIQAVNLAMGHLLLNGRRGIYTDRARRMCASIERHVELRMPWLELDATMKGGAPAPEGELGAHELWLLAALGLGVARVG